ncbi:MAG: hypothetical protein ACI360_03640 [Atopobiaceae bacterium]
MIRFSLQFGKTRCNARDPEKGTLQQGPSAGDAAISNDSAVTSTSGKPAASPASKGVDLRKLDRIQLLQLLQDAIRENERLRAQLAEANRQLEDRRIAIQESGSLAEAALRLSGIFTDAQRAIELYGYNVELNKPGTAEEPSTSVKQSELSTSELADNFADAPEPTDQPESDAALADVTSDEPIDEAEPAASDAADVQEPAPLNDVTADPVATDPASSAKEATAE